MLFGQNKIFGIEFLPKSDFFNIYENVRQGGISISSSLSRSVSSSSPEKGLKGPTVKHLSVLARRHMITVGVGLPNQPVGLMWTS